MPFSFFKKKEGPAITDIVWMDHKSRMKGVLQLFDASPGALPVAWFERSVREWQQFFDEAHKGVTVHNAQRMPASTTSGKEVFLLEHYPLRSVESEKITTWEASSIKIFTALDDPMMLHFGGEKIVEMMKKMGMADSESLQHSLITKSIENAGRKLDEKVTNELHASSQEEWFKLNFL